MKIESIREMTPAELNSELLKLKNELFNLRFQPGSQGRASIILKRTCHVGVT